MTFEEILVHVREMLEREGRVAYRILKRRFELNDDDLEDLKADLIDAKRMAVDEDGKVLVRVGTTLPKSQRAKIKNSNRSLIPDAQGEADLAPRTCKKRRRCWLSSHDFRVNCTDCSTKSISN